MLSDSANKYTQYDEKYITQPLHSNMAAETTEKLMGMQI